MTITEEKKKFVDVFGITPQQMGDVLGRKVLIQGEYIETEDIESGRVLSFFAKPRGRTIASCVGSAMVPADMLDIPRMNDYSFILPYDAQIVFTIVEPRTGSNPAPVASIDERGNIYVVDAYHYRNPIPVDVVYKLVHFLENPDLMIEAVLQHHLDTRATRNARFVVNIERQPLSDEDRDAIVREAISIAAQMTDSKNQALREKYKAEIAELKRKATRLERELKAERELRLQTTISTLHHLIDAGWRVNDDGDLQMKVKVEALKSGRQIKRVPPDKAKEFTVTITEDGYLESRPEHPHIDSNGVPCWGDYASLPLINRLCAFHDFLATINLNSMYTCPASRWAEEMWENLPDSEENVFVVD